MLHAGLDLSRKRLDYCLLDELNPMPPGGNDGLRLDRPTSTAAAELAG